MYKPPGAFLLHTDSIKTVLQGESKNSVRLGTFNPNIGC
jgi:hypothetical protein